MQKDAEFFACYCSFNHARMTPGSCAQTTLCITIPSSVRWLTLTVESLDPAFPRGFTPPEWRLARPNVLEAGPVAIPIKEVVSRQMSF